MIELTDENFEEEVAKGPIVADFWAPWCATCLLLGPVVEELAKEFKDKIRFAKVNVDENVKVVIKYNIFSIPTLIIFNNIENKIIVVDNIIGAQPKNVIKERLEQVVGKLEDDNEETTST